MHSFKYITLLALLATSHAQAPTAGSLTPIRFSNEVSASHTTVSGPEATVDSKTPRATHETTTSKSDTESRSHSTHTDTKTSGVAAPTASVLALAVALLASCSL
ncbi:hypothetical protein EC988_003741, partial [Linderina pennispora]